MTVVAMALHSKSRRGARARSKETNRLLWHDIHRISTVFIPLICISLFQIPFDIYRAYAEQCARSVQLNVLCFYCQNKHHEIIKQMVHMDTYMEERTEYNKIKRYQLNKTLIDVLWPSATSPMGTKYDNIVWNNPHQMLVHCGERTALSRWINWCKSKRRANKCLPIFFLFLFIFRFWVFLCFE